MHITSTYARKAPCHLLRESYWENGKVKKRTLANLSALPQHLIDLLRLALANQLPAGHDGSALALGPARQHGAVSAVLGTAGRLQLDSLLFSRPCRQRSLALAMIVSRLLCPGSKLCVERELGPAGRSTLAALLDLRNASADDLYDAMDWLALRQTAIERKLAKRHLAAGSLALYDVSSSYLEGSRCELASRDHRPDRSQIVYGLLCSPQGCPVAVEAFPGNTADPDTLAARVQVLRERFGLQRVALVGDRGMIAQTRIDADLQPAGFDWITALRGDTLRKLVKRNVIQPGLFDTPDLASVTCEEYPGERLLVCYNPLVAAERLDGIYVIRTSLQEEQLGDAETVWAYKSLAQVERAFRSLKSLLAVRPVFHWKQRRVRAHLLICMLAYYLEWHMRERLAPLLFLDEDQQEGKTGPVGPAVRSERGKRKDRTRETLEGNLPLQSFPDLLAHLTTLSALELRLEAAPEHRVSKLSALTPLQERAFELLGSKPHPAPPPEPIAAEPAEPSH